MHTTSAAIVGASGYTGLELTRLVAGHPRLRLTALLSDRWDGERAGDRSPLDGPAAALRYGKLDSAPSLDAEVVFLATPAEASLALAPVLAARGAQVVDLSGAFRLADAALYPAWYGFEHTAPALLREARYGLPELFRDGLAGARFLSVPGCYATAVALALAPLVAARVVSPQGIRVAASSGVSGAGRKASEEYSFCETEGDLRAYRIGRHQHVPEIEQTVARSAGACGPLSFTPHLVPMQRGILATCVLPLVTGAAQGELSQALERAYSKERFVKVAAAEKVAVKNVVRTNRAQVGVAADARAGVAIAVCAIDNLMKGAGGQALQALNAARGWDEGLGISEA